VSYHTCMERGLGFKVGSDSLLSWSLKLSQVSESGLARQVNFGVVTRIPKAKLNQTIILGNRHRFCELWSESAGLGNKV